MPLFSQLFHRISMESLLASLNGLSPPELEIIVRAAIDLLTADEKAALWIALASSGMVQVMDLDQKTSPQCGVRRGRPPKAEVCQELIYQSVRFVMWFGMLLLVTSCSRLFELRKNHAFFVHWFFLQMSFNRAAGTAGTTRHGRPGHEARCRNSQQRRLEAAVSVVCGQAGSSRSVGSATNFMWTRSCGLAS